jgi:hypothetical protein
MGMKKMRRDGIGSGGRCHSVRLDRYGVRTRELGCWIGEGDLLWAAGRYLVARKRKLRWINCGAGRIDI